MLLVNKFFLQIFILLLNVFTNLVVKLPQLVLSNIFWQLQSVQFCCDLFQFANLRSREIALEFCPASQKWLYSSASA